MKSGSWELTDLYPGAHIRVQIGDFYHHGIYIGDGEVVQFGLPFDVYTDPSQVKVLRSPLKDFCSNAVFIEVYHFSKKELKQKLPDEQIVKTALSKVGEGGYSVIANNCEHFANYCVFGKKTSKQIDDIYESVAALLNKNEKQN